MKEIHLTKGKVALVDDEDYDRLNQVKWSYTNKGYAVRQVKGKPVYMHRVIMNPGKARVDHKNGNKLDNQKANLRLATDSENQHNKRGWGSSGYKGVYWSKKNKRWEAEIRLDWKKHRLGGFTNPALAAYAYDQAAKRLHGVFAKVNFPSVAQKPGQIVILNCGDYFIGADKS